MNIKKKSNNISKISNKTKTFLLHFQYINRRFVDIQVSLINGDYNLDSDLIDLHSKAFFSLGTFPIHFHSF